MRSVFFIPDPVMGQRVPIAELTRDGARVFLRRLPLPEDLPLDQRACIEMALGDIVEQVSTTCSLADGKVVRGAPPLDALPSSVGPQVVLGDLVRVTYSDGTSEDLDERTFAMLGVGKGETLASMREECRRNGSWPVLGHCREGGRALVWTGGAWADVSVESWEQEARRLRQGIANLAYRLERRESADVRHKSWIEARKLIQPKRRGC